jgi:hypothetical protein
MKTALSAHRKLVLRLYLELIVSNKWIGPSSLVDHPLHGAPHKTQDFGKRGR